MLNDLIISKKIKEGDIKAFEQVFRLYYTPLLLYSMGITSRKDIAEEIIQDVFYNLWKDRQDIQILRSLKSYLYKAVRNHSLQYLERLEIENRYKNSALPDSTTATEYTALDNMEYKELEEVINHTLKRLPERRRTIFKMHRMEGKKYKEIALILSLSVKTIEAEMTKTYQILRQEIEKYTHII